MHCDWEKATGARSQMEGAGGGSVMRSDVEEACIWTQTFQEVLWIPKQRPKREDYIAFVLMKNTSFDLETRLAFLLNLEGVFPWAR